MKEKLIQKIQEYQPFNQQEILDKATILNLLAGNTDISRRENLIAHLTASAWVVNPERTKVLMAYHNLYNSWAWLGGHADGNFDLAAVAIKEAREEAGLSDVHLVSDDILSLEVLTVNGHEKKGEYVPCHLHLNCTYLLEADPSAPIRCKEDENKAVGWFSLEGAIAASKEHWFQTRVYQKLNDKLAEFCRIKAR